MVDFSIVVDWISKSRKKTPSTSYFVLGFGWFPRKKASEVPRKIKNHSSFGLVIFYYIGDSHTIYEGTTYGGGVITISRKSSGGATINSFSITKRKFRWAFHKKKTNTQKPRPVHCYTHTVLSKLYLGSRIFTCMFFLRQHYCLPFVDLSSPALTALTYNNLFYMHKIVCSCVPTLALLIATWLEYLHWPTTTCSTSIKLCALSCR